MLTHRQAHGLPCLNVSTQIRDLAYCSTALLFFMVSYTRYWDKMIHHGRQNYLYFYYDLHNIRGTPHHPKICDAHKKIWRVYFSSVIDRCCFRQFTWATMRLCGMPVYRSLRPNLYSTAKESMRLFTVRVSDNFPLFSRLKLKLGQGLIQGGE